jgi:hypothetical protein
LNFGNQKLLWKDCQNFKLFDVLFLKVVCGKVIAILDHNTFLDVAIPLQLDSHLLIIRNNNMAKKVEVLVPVMLIGIDKDFEDVYGLETRKLFDEMIDST